MLGFCLWLLWLRATSFMAVAGVSFELLTEWHYKVPLQAFQQLPSKTHSTYSGHNHLGLGGVGGMKLEKAQV